MTRSSPTCAHEWSSGKHVRCVKCGAKPTGLPELEDWAKQCAEKRPTEFIDRIKKTMAFYESLEKEDEQRAPREEGLHRCAGPSCPGLPWKASERPHPTSCRQPRPAHEADDLVWRLRQAVADKSLPIGEAWNLLDEAADAIARLRAESEVAAARVRGAEEALLLARQRLRDAAKYDSVRILDEQLADLRQPAAPANERIEWRTGSEWEDVDGADGSKPIVPEPLRQPRPAQDEDVFDRVAGEWIHANGETSDADFLRKRFGPVVEALEMIANDRIEDRYDEDAPHSWKEIWEGGYSALRDVARAALVRLRAAGGSQ